MKSVLRTVIIMTAVLPASLFAQQRSFSVKDDIAMVRFSDPRPEPATPGSDVVHPSPDGKHFAIVTTRGILERDLIESQIQLFDRADIERFLDGVRNALPRPKAIAQVQSFPHEAQPSPYAPVIKDMQWSDDGKQVYFRGEGKDGIYRLYSASLDGKSVQALTPPNLSIDRFDMDGDMIVYRAGSKTMDRLDNRYTINPDAEVATGRRLQDILFSSRVDEVAARNYTIGIIRRRSGAWTSHKVPEFSVQEVPYLGYLFPFEVAPRGDVVLTMTPFSTIPQSWEQYSPAPGYQRLRFGLDDEHRTHSDNLNRPLQYSLVEVRTGRVIPLINAPNARTLAYLGHNRAVWAPSGKRVFLTNTFMEIPDAQAATKTVHYPCAATSIDLPRRKPRCLFYMEGKGSAEVVEVRAGNNDDEVTLLVMSEPGKYAAQTYRLTGAAWQLTSSTPFPGTSYQFLHPNQVSSDSFQIRIHQGLNTPPTLWVSTGLDGSGKQLWDPNPQLKHLLFGEASLYQWRDSSGTEWNGALIKPTNYNPTKRYPLVIQMYSFQDGVFLTDGTDPTAFAARHLASAGIMVLQIQKKTTTVTESDATTSLEGYRSAISSLAAKGLIDSQKVGVVGFSWTCWYALNALVNDPPLFAAATIADGLTNSYMEYLLFDGGSYALRLQLEKIRGSSPFSKGLNNWVASAPGFHLDQVRTPLRLEAITPLSLLSEWEVYASLKMQDKPVDLIYFPNGMHIHQRPLARLESQQGSIDWQRFWLQGYEDSDPTKTEQYQRWRIMKAQLQHRDGATAAHDMR